MSFAEFDPASDWPGRVGSELVLFVATSLNYPAAVTRMALEPKDIIAQHIVQAPMAKLLGVRLEEFAPDLVRVRLPFRSELTTIGDLVHGGALSALIDVAATAAAWSRADLERSPRGTTIGFPRELSRRRQRP